MVHLFDFHPSKEKPLERFAENPDGVPKFWKGYIALFKPNTITKKQHYSAYWFASNKGKKIKQAVFVKENL